MRGFVQSLAATATLLSFAIAEEPSAQKPAAIDVAAIEATASFNREIGAVVGRLLEQLTAKIEIMDDLEAGLDEASLKTFEQRAAAIDPIVAAARSEIDALAARKLTGADPHALREKLVAYGRRMADDIDALSAPLGEMIAAARANDEEALARLQGESGARTAKLLEAENALLSVSQLAMNLGSPEFHLIEAVKNGNSAIARFFTLLASVDNPEAMQASAEELSMFHKGIGVSLGAASAIIDGVEKNLVAAFPGAEQEGKAFVAAYRDGIAIESAIGETIGAYVPVSAEIAAGADPGSFVDRLDEISVGFDALIARRQAAGLERQEAALAVVRASQR